VPIFGGASRGAILELRCPHCGTTQARARERAGTSYRCKACDRSFTREEGLARAAADRAADASAKARKSRR
jgi:transposase-like protein